MPTFKHGWAILRSINSLLAQEFDDWELIIVNDGSPDDTTSVISHVLSDCRIRYFGRPVNRGIGESLSFALEQARGALIAYLPSDDVYFPDHLATLVNTLDSDQSLYLAYGGLVCNSSLGGWHGPTLQGSAAVGRESAALQGQLDRHDGLPLSGENLLAMVQVLHRRDLEQASRWVPRTECVSDSPEADYWRSLLEFGAKFGYSGAVTCEWTDHPDQHHKIVAEAFVDRQPATFVPWSKAGRGRSAYRVFYEIPKGVPLNWRPSSMQPVAEAKSYAPLLAKQIRPSKNGMRILLVGSLGHNPERILALEEAGHTLYGIWIRHPEHWDQAGGAPYGNLVDIPYDDNWRDAVKAIAPDIIYALLNQQALPLIDEVVSEGLGIPIAFHFKESPFSAMRHGLWSTLERVLDSSNGHIFISEENRSWFQVHFPQSVGRKPSMILDGELPKADWMTNDWSPKISESDGEIHTVCAGRPVGHQFILECVALGIHVHFYEQPFHLRPRRPITDAKYGGRVHVHDAVSAEDWVREFSRYDAAWLHVSENLNGGRIRSCTWNDLNIPARFGTYLTAGLPMLVKDPGPHISTIGRLVERCGVGIPFRAHLDVVEALERRDKVEKTSLVCRSVRREFAFDHHVEDLIGFFRSLIGRG